MYKTRPISSPRAVSPPATIHCIECRRSWIDGAERWRLKVLDEDPPETVPYCPECATREFGSSHAGSL